MKIKSHILKAQLSATVFPRRFFNTYKAPSKITWSPIATSLAERKRDGYDVDIRKSYFAKQKAMLINDKVSFWKASTTQQHWSLGLPFCIIYLQSCLVDIKLFEVLKENKLLFNELITPELMNAFMLSVSITPTILCYLTIYKILKHFTFKNQLLKVNDPTHLQALHFNQEDFDDLIIARYPQLKFNKNGNCYGHINIWYLHCMNGEDYIQKIKNIEKNVKDYKPLNAQEHNLLKAIAEKQSNTPDVNLEPDTIDPFFLSTFIHHRRQVIVSEIIDEVVKNHESFFKLRVLSRKHGHVIGIFADKAGVIKIFDPNFGEFTCANSVTTKIFLSNLVGQYYSLRQPHLIGYSSVSDCCSTPEAMDKLAKEELPENLNRYKII